MFGFKLALGLASEFRLFLDEPAWHSQLLQLLEFLLHPRGCERDLVLVLVRVKWNAVVGGIEVLLIYLVDRELDFFRNLLFQLSSLSFCPNRIHAPEPLFQMEHAWVRYPLSQFIPDHDILVQQRLLILVHLRKFIRQFLQQRDQQIRLLVIADVAPALKFFLEASLLLLLHGQY